MRFAAAVFAFLVAACDAAAPIRRRLDKRKIMENAVRVNSKGERHLNQDFEMSSGYSIQFNHCVSLKTEPYNDEIMFADDLIRYTSKGQIVSQQSYILFNVCETKFCDYYSDDDNLFMIDIDTYMASITEVYLERQENYCTACLKSRGYCGYIDDQNAAYDANSYYEEYIANNNGYQQYSNENYSYGSQYYGNGYWDNVNNNKNQQQQSYQQYYQQQGQQQNYGDGTNYAMGYQDYGYGYKYNNGNRMLANAQYQQIDCDTCEDFQCFAGMEKATEQEMAEYEQQRYASWQEAQAEYEAQAAAAQEEANEEAQGDDDGNANGGRRVEEADDDGDGDDDDGDGEQDDDQYQYTDVDLESAAAWVEDIAGCQETDGLLEEWWPLYAGFICNEDGSGVDIGLFLDDGCSIYTSKESFQNVASDDDQAYANGASGLITYTFLNDISCDDELTFLSVQEYAQMLRNYQYDQDAANEAYGDANEYCQGLFEGGALSLHDCNQDGYEDEMDENAEVEYYSYDYVWYSYVLSYGSDLETTCSVIQNMQGEYTPVYSWKKSGQLFDYGTGPSRWDTTGIRSFFSAFGEDEKMDGILIAAIVLAVMFALFSCICVLWSCCGSKIKKRASRKIGKENDSKKQGLIESKKQELIDSRTGKMLQ